MMNVRILFSGAVLAAALTSSACVPAAPHANRLGRQFRSGLSPVSYSLVWALPSGTGDDRPKLELGSDQTVGVAGFLGQTVNEVVPIPGTDMVRVGALQEGSLFQSSFRSPQQEGTILSEAFVVFRINRPVHSW